jgi:hypothetical protein
MAALFSAGTNSRTAVKAVAGRDRRFPVRIRIGVPPEGLGQRHTQITVWLDENCGADGWAGRSTRRASL